MALPGLEDLVEAEIREWFPDFKLKREHGGVTVKAPLGEGLAMNLALKTATRVLLRVHTFRCRDFPKLYNKVRTFEWEDFIAPSCEMSVNVATRLSRLKIKARIEESVMDGWIAHAKEAKATLVRGKKAELFVRFLEDDCTMSLDTSGERLHKRGLRELIGEAPLRESIAASLIQLVGRAHAADYGDTDRKPADVEIVDPMMGSGTFLLEAALRDIVIESREFAFENFAQQPSGKPKLQVTRPKIVALTGFEVDKKTMAAAKGNLKTVEKVLGRRVDMNSIAEDIFKAEPLPPTENQRWVFCNPPYGERLKVKEHLAEYYAKLFAAVDKVAKPDRACFLLPSKAVKGKFVLPLGWKVLEKRPFVNGGIPVTAFVFGRA